ncbi:MAG: class I SAM-dependent methyltransferase [Bacteroidetes bacterium]|nr:class I SAM-dependent methyltransferase [Bacteroidota bacterium]
MISLTPARAATLIELAAELARLLLKSSQPPRELASTYLHQQKRLDGTERQFVSSATHHALRVWRFARACGNGVTGDVDLRPSVDETQTVTAAALLLSLRGFVPPFDDGEIEGAAGTAVEDACIAILKRRSTDGVESLLLRAEDWQSACISAEAVFAPMVSGLGESTSAAGEETTMPEDAWGEAVAVRWSLPDWVVRSWREHQPPFSFADISELGRGLCAAAPLVLRTNRMRGEREALLSALREAGITATAHAILPDAVISERRPLMESHWYEDGLFEIQDAGSQLIVLGCGVTAGMNIMDACAGGGGKTMQLADTMRDQGSIVACDIERHKLRGLEQRGKRLALGSIRTLALTPVGMRTDGREPFDPDMKFDCVLVDAPCSGFGTVRRHPALKWRLTEKTVARLAERQAAILARNAAYVKAGGILLYATCSLLPQENSANVRRFLEKHDDFSLDPLAPQLLDAGVSLRELHADSGELLLSPTLLDSDGFYMARLCRDTSS